MHSGRPHPCSRLLRAVAAASVLALAIVAPALAKAPATRFHRDETPLPASVTGVGTKAGAHISAAGAGSTGGGVLHMLLALGIVIALILGLYKLLRRTAERNDKTVAGDGRMTVVASTPLAPSRSVHLIRVGQELVLVGASEHAVTPIRVYSAEESRMIVLDEPDDLRPFGGNGDAKPGSFGAFAESLRKLTAR